MLPLRKLAAGSFCHHLVCVPLGIARSSSETFISYCSLSRQIRGFSNYDVQQARRWMKNAERMLSEGRITQEMFDKVRQAAATVEGFTEVESESASQRSLHTLAEGGDIVEVQKMLEEGPDPNAADKNGTTPLLVAIRKGHEDVAQTLIAHGASVNKAGNWGFTPLMYAAIFGQRNLAAVLLANGADPRPKDVRGDTALDHAVGERQPDIAQMIEKALDCPGKGATSNETS